MDLKDTVNLPRTAFPMRAQLAEREPAQVKAWLEGKVYEQILRRNAGHERFVFHDGPPYANGSIHLGHFLNKILKDIVVKHASMSRKLSDFVDRKSTRLNSSHSQISYAVFCLKKKKKR